MPTYSGARSAIPQETFLPYIVEKLRRTNPHLDYAMDESGAVLDGSIVHIPNAGAAPGVTTNRGTFPATASQRVDTKVSYALDVHSTDPQHVTWHEANEISYNKTDSVLADHVAKMAEAVGNWMLYRWAVGLTDTGTAYANATMPLTSIIRTSGAVAAVNPYDGQTLTRKALTMDDLGTACALMNKQNVPATDRYALLESYMYKDLLASMSQNQAAAFAELADLKRGIVGELHGFKILSRSSVLAFNAAATTVLLPGQALAATDCLGCLCWQKQSVSKAIGEVKMFQTKDDPQYYGDMFSALVKAGGRCRRGDWAGLIAIVQQ